MLQEVDLKIRSDLADALSEWKQDPYKFKNMSKAIESALGDGVDLKVEVSKSVLVGEAPNSRGITKWAASHFGYMSADRICFYIYSELGKRSKPDTGLTVSVENDRGNPALKINDRTIGVIGEFFPIEITSVEPK